MNFLKVFYLGCFFSLFSMFSIQASECQCYRPCQESNSNFGTSGFGGSPDLWYTISTHSYPDSVPLSLNRNKGLSEGGVYPSPTGFTIGEGGDYWISITAILQNLGADTILIPVFLALNEEFNPDDPEVGGVVTLEPNIISNLHGTGIVKNIEPGTRLSLVATNAGAPLPQDVVVVAWSISLFKLP